MEDFTTYTLKMLQTKCREAGLPTSGNKAQLRNRLENMVQQTRTPDIDTRISQIEKSLADMHAMFVSFQPNDNSSMIMSTNNVVSSAHISAAQPSHRSMLQFESNDNDPRSNAPQRNEAVNMTPVGSRIANNVLTLVQNVEVDNARETAVLNEISPQTMSFGSRPVAYTVPTSYTNATSSIFANELYPTQQQPLYTRQPDMFSVAPCLVSSSHRPIVTSSYAAHPEYSQQQQHQQQRRSFAPCVDNFHEAQLVSAQQLNYGNPFSNIREILNLLPEFNPSCFESLNSSQFIKRVEVLKLAYGWDDRSLVFAIQQKMCGPAKYWIDSLQTVFQSWQQFVETFLADFPHVENIADIHVKMSTTLRHQNESPQDYYFKMLSLGRNGSLPESAICRHIINGINDPNLKRIISKEYASCSSLLRDINCYCSYNTVSAAAENKQSREPYVTSNASKTKTTSAENVFAINNTAKKNVSSNTSANIVNNNNSLKNVKCYNCFCFGHYSKNCPQPQRKERCEICKRTTHKTNDCPLKKVDNQNNVANVNKVKMQTPSPTIDLTKRVKVNGVESIAFVDSGSCICLIRETFALNIGKAIDCFFTLDGFAGGQYVCKNKIRVSLEIDETIFDVEMFIVNDDLLKENVYIGSDVVCRNGYKSIIENGEFQIHSIEAENQSIKVELSTNVELERVLEDHGDCFAESVADLGRCNVLKMKIQLATDVPVSTKPYRMPFAKRAAVNNIVQELLESNIIRESESPYASGVVLVEKKNKEQRLCIDYRMLNKITMKTPFPMPIMDELIAQLAGNRYFSTLDLRMGYHQIEIDESSKQFTAFVTIDGHYEFNRMPFGLVNAPAVFQNVMNRVAKQMNPGEVVVYLDDVIIVSKTIEEGIDRLSRFLKILRKTGLTLRRDKCKFLSEEISFLGYNISAQGIMPGDKVNAIKEFKIPKSVTEVRRFLGLTGFFRKFVKDYSLISRPLTKLLRKANENVFEWGEQQQYSFNQLVKTLCEKPVLAIYDVNCQHEVHTDASSLGLAGVLLQADENQKWHPVFYFSRHCTDAESKYHSYELEVLAVVETLERFRVYLLGKSFRVLTDCSAISKLKANKELIPRVARWFLKMMEYDCEFIHRESSRMAHVDALSRSPVEQPNEIEPAGFVLKIDSGSDDWLTTMQLQDADLRFIMGVLNNINTSENSNQIKTDYVLQNHRLFRKTEAGIKFVVPKAVRWRIVKLCHDDMGHFGLEKTIERIKQKFWFKRLRKYVKEYIAACTSCCYNKIKGGKPEGELHYAPIEPIPFRQIHIDHLGPLVKSKKGNSYILAISDAFTKYVVVKAVRNTKSLPVINILNELSGYFGLPKRIISDRGTAFTASMFETYCKENNIEHVKTAVRTPRANGQVERANQTILSYLRTSTDNPKDWDLALHKLQWVINSQKNLTSGFTPNELIFDFKPIDVIQNYLIAAVHDEIEPSVSDVSMTDKRKLAMANIESERLKWKMRFDSKRRAPIQYREGDLVVIENEPQATGESRKLEPKFRGPYIISRALRNDRYVIEDIPGMHISSRKFSSVYSSEKLKPWCNGIPEVEADDESSEVEDDL